MGSKLHSHLLNVIPIERELGRRSFHEFVKMAWSAIDPADFVDGWHIELICEYLEKCYRRELRRFIINIPPRHCKSSIVSVLFPAWCWINDPKLKFFLFSYAMKLCERDTVKCRRLIQSEWFRERWGDTVQLMEDQNQVRKYETTVGGVRTISSVAGPVTGEGGDFLILDDPHNVIEGESEAVRDSTVQWWSEAVSSRLNDERTGVKIIIQQRVHELDLSGEMIRAGYDHLVLPFEFEENHPFRHPRDIRKVDGEILWKAKFGNEEVQRKKSELGSYAYAGQYQQRPAPREGGMFEERWFLADGIIINPWQVPEGGITVGGWDIAASNTKDSAYSCRVKMKKVNGAYYILDVLRWKLSPGKLERRVQDTVASDGIYIHRHSFPQDPGAAGKIVARNWKVLLAGYPIRYTPESGSKENRAMSFAAQVEIGNVHLVKGPWIQKYITECCTFPNGRYKDQVDASSRAFHEILSIERNGVEGGDIGKTLEIALLQSEHPSVGFYKDWEYTEMPKDETPLVAAPIG